jgi:hypothetical protein
VGEQGIKNIEQLASEPSSSMSRLVLTVAIATRPHRRQRNETPGLVPHGEPWRFTIDAHWIRSST